MATSRLRVIESRLGPAGVRRQTTRRSRFRYHRRHKPHFYLATTALSLALLLCAVDAIALAAGSTFAGQVAFGVLSLTVIVVLATYFLGFFMVMDGNIPTHRIRVFLPHALVGALSPLLYMLNFSLAFDALGQGGLRPASLGLAVFSASLISIQYLMGRRVTRVEPPRLLRSGEDDTREEAGGLRAG